MTEKRVMVNIQANRKVSGILRGFDIFMNLVRVALLTGIPQRARTPELTECRDAFALVQVLEDARDESTPGREEKMEGGPVVRSLQLCLPEHQLILLHPLPQIIRGNSIASLELVPAY